MVRRRKPIRRALLVALLALALWTESPSTSAVEPALVPALSSISQQQDGFAFVISNFNNQYTWSVTSTVGTARLQIGLVTITGLAPGQIATVTVTSKRTGYRDGSATVTGSSRVISNPTQSPYPRSSPSPQPTYTSTPSTNYAPKPEFSSILATEFGFTATILNFDPNFNWTLTATSGKVNLTGSTITVTQLNSAQSSRVTVTSSRSGYISSTSTLTGTSRSQSSPTSQPSPVNSTSSSSSPSPTSSATPSATSSPKNSATPRPSTTSSPTTSASPTNSATPTATPTSTAVNNKIGSPIALPRTPLINGALVLVPTRTAITTPKSIAKPNATFNYLLIGGTTTKQSAQLPKIAFSAALKKPVEVQLVRGIPTSIEISGFKGNYPARVTIADSSDKSIAISKLQTTTKGVLRLPAITLTRANKSLEVRITVAAKTEVFTIRN